MLRLSWHLASHKSVCIPAHGLKKHVIILGMFLEFHYIFQPLANHHKHWLLKNC